MAMKRINVTITEQLRDLMRTEVDRTGTSDSHVVRKALDMYYGIQSPPVRRGRPEKHKTE